MTQDAPFIFNEATASFQEVAIQGQLTYRLESPLDTAELLDFTIDPRTGRYRSSDPDKLTQRVINAVQAHTRKGVNELSLEQALTQVKELAQDVVEKVRSEPALTALGVVVELADGVGLASVGFSAFGAGCVAGTGFVSAADCEGTGSAVGLGASSDC